MWCRWLTPVLRAHDASAARNYALPAVKAVEGWIKQTPPGFVFHVKAYGMLTTRPMARNSLPWTVKDSLPPQIADKAMLSFQQLPAASQQLLWDRFHEVCGGPADRWWTPCVDE